MQSTRRIGFHESTITEIRNENEALVLSLDGVHFGDAIRPAAVRIAGIRAITRDGTQINALCEDCQDAEILTLEYSDQVLQLIVECTDHNLHRNQTHSYRIACDLFEVEAR